MVKHSFYILLLLLAASCHEQPQSVEKGTAAFDTQSFKLSNYNRRVQQFLQSRKETKGISDYVAIFVNTQGCSACVKGGFEQISPYLTHTETKTFIYVNDSTVITSELENDQLEFIWLPAETYRSRDVFHGDIYLYAIHGEEITPTDLNIQTTDSLNKLAQQPN